MSKPKVFFSIPGASRVIDLSESRTRQKYKAGDLKADAMLDGKRPLFAAETLESHKSKQPGSVR